MTFGNKIKNLRKEHQLTQTKLAQNLGISLRALVYYENGHRLPPQPVLLQFSEYFGVDVDYLVNDEANSVEERLHRQEKLSSSALLTQASTLLAGGDLSAEDKEKFLRALMEVYEEAEEREFEFRRRRRRTKKA